MGWHPHRGFETVTVAWAGIVAHRDNAGHAGINGPGDLQWMTAGRGIFHEEYHQEEFSRRGGRMHMTADPEVAGWSSTRNAAGR